MEVVITALGPDHTGLADPIIHHLTGRGARIAEIQMYDHDERSLFAMMCRIQFDQSNTVASHLQLMQIQDEMRQIGQHTALSIRAWSPDAPPANDSMTDHPSQPGGPQIDTASASRKKPRLAVACTYVEHTPRAVLQAVDDGLINAEVPVVLSNRKKLGFLADEFDCEFRMIGDGEGGADNDALVNILDELQIDYLILARYMRVLPAEVCWQFAGGRIINLHHGLLPGFPGFRPYHDANNARMLTFGATCHFIIPELDAGNQTINQRTFSVAPGTPIEAIIAQGERENEPKCLVEGVRRVVDREVYLHFHRVVPRKAAANATLG